MSSHCSGAGRPARWIVAVDDLTEESFHDNDRLARLLFSRRGGGGQRPCGGRRPGVRRDGPEPGAARSRTLPGPGIAGAHRGLGIGVARFERTAAHLAATAMSWAFPAAWPAASPG